MDNVTGILKSGCILANLLHYENTNIANKFVLGKYFLERTREFDNVCSLSSESSSNCGFTLRLFVLTET